jgi:aspartyl-tRNA synthetase
MQRKLKLRHDVTYATREYLDSRGFYEIETPTLIKSTPEGARDFLVPARLHPGKFFALPQSPQLFKQILMVSGIDKYFQIPRCYRDEDARGDRQLEFTQIDLEMSFVSQDDVFDVVEGLMKHIFDKAMDYTVDIPFRRISFADAMNRYGTDKPDLRFGLEIKDVTDIAAASGFKVFKSVADSGGSVKALRVPGCAGYSRKQIDELEAAAKIYGAKGLAWMKVTGAENPEAQKALALDGGISKFFLDQAGKILDRLGCEEGDLLLFVADKWNTACIAMGAVRSRLGKDLGLIKQGEFEFCWIVDFPLFEWNEEENRWDPAHHMFTMPKEEYIDTLEQDPGSVIANVYDLVINGSEIASGSIRIHDPKLQSRIFSILGFSEEEAERRFGFLLKAFKYGPPPHGGIAPGLDRLVMIMAGEETIREVIPFPKNTVGASPMEDSPSYVDPKQVEELHLRIVPPEDSGREEKA